MFGEKRENPAHFYGEVSGLKGRLLTRVKKGGEYFLKKKKRRTQVLTLEEEIDVGKERELSSGGREKRAFRNAPLSSFCR